MRVLVLNGPNLARLDLRDSKFYGDLNFTQLKEFITSAALAVDLEVDIRQSDSETEIIGWLHEAADFNLDRKSVV